MENRQLTLERLDKIYKRYQRLKEMVENSSDESLNDILDNLFWEYTTNIQINFDCLEMMISRRTPEGDIFCETKTDMTNDELVAYFDEYWYLLTSP
jgi:hypothetical protein